jgi:hypothetical protein
MVFMPVSLADGFSVNKPVLGYWSLLSSCWTGCLAFGPLGMGALTDATGFSKN